MKLFDTVRLKQDRNDLGIKHTFEGTIVDVHNNGEAFTVEFFDEAGDTIMASIHMAFRPQELVLSDEYPQEPVSATASPVKPMAEYVRERLAEYASIMTFVYKGKNCGIDPFSPTKFNVWYGENRYRATSLEDVMTKPYFGGESLEEIAAKVEFTPWQYFCMGGANNMAPNGPGEVFCPLVERMIEDIDCIESRECVDGMIILSCLPDEFKQKPNFKEICKACKWHDY